MTFIFKHAILYTNVYQRSYSIFLHQETNSVADKLIRKVATNGVATKDQLYKRPTPTKDQRLQKTNSTKDQHLQKTNTYIRITPIYCYIKIKFINKVIHNQYMAAALAPLAYNLT